MSQDQDDDRTIIRPAGSPPGGTAAPAPAAMSSSGHDYHNALPLGTYLGEFELQGVIGEGGFGIVYLAWDHSLQRRVALKEYFPSSLAARAGGHTVSVKSERHRETFQAGLSSFVNEARLLAQFDHASLVKVYRFWEANDTAYMVMPFYEGETLKDTLRDLGAPPDEAWLMGVLAPLTEALEVIHAEQCYHRDIAPDNVILLKGSKRPLLLDFGAARRVIGDMTQALTVILKPGYAPVEQYAEVPGMKQGPWTDVYALAALIYNAITGKTPPTSVGRLMNDNYQPLAEVAQGRYSDRFLQAVDRALKVKPDDRTPNIGALRADLGMDQSPVLASQRTVMPGATPTPARLHRPLRPVRPPTRLRLSLPRHRRALRPPRWPQHLPDPPPQPAVPVCTPPWVWAPRPWSVVRPGGCWVAPGRLQCHDHGARRRNAPDRGQPCGQCDGACGPGLCHTRGDRAGRARPQPERPLPARR